MSDTLHTTRAQTVADYDRALSDILDHLGDAEDILRNLTDYGLGWHPAYDERTNNEDAWALLAGARRQTMAALLHHRHVTAEMPQHANTAAPIGDQP